MSAELSEEHSVVQRLMEELEQERAARREVEALLRLAREAVEVIQRSETYFRHLTEYAVDLITILEADGTIRFESRSISAELGWEKEDYVGRNAFEFVHPEDRPAVMRAFQSALENHGNTPVMSFRFLHKDGSYRILEGRGNNLLDDSAVTGIVFNSRDVTEKRRLEAQLFQSQKVQAIGQLTAGVAHDFNNILTAVIGYSELTVPKVEPGSVVQSNVLEIRKAALRAAALTRQLLAFSRKQVLQPRVVALDTIIQDMDKMLRRVLGEHIDFVTVSNPDAGNVRADPGQIEQVLLNMAVNARDAMPGGGALTIESRNVALDENYAILRNEVVPGEYVMLGISDTGTGMTPEVLAHLFEPFFTTKAQGKGTGLGLATCHGIVKQSGGHIAVYSELGKGTTFKVFLPRVNADAEPWVAEEMDSEAPSGDETLLLVEDEPMLRELGSTVLTECGYRVITAENGVDALRIFRELSSGAIDLVITDVVMPEMGGKELMENLRTVAPGTKVIFCSGYAEDAIFHGGALDTGVCFLQKPYTIAGIARKVREALAVK